MEDLIYEIGLSLIPGVGCVTGKQLVAYCGGVKAVFMERRAALLRIPGLGEKTVNSIINQNVLSRAEEECKFIERNHIRALFYLDKEYPKRLKLCNDNPLMLYYKGNADLNNMKVIGLVGTRLATEYGRDMCRKIVEGLVEQNALVVSGLAFGIDTWSHKAALDFNLPTVGVLGHGLDQLYPPQNHALAEKMQEHGGILSEFVSKTKPDRENFPMRNRIVAGMCDALVVVESGRKGGALITAEIANSYNREVFAVPGRVGDMHSEGCNNLIRRNSASLINSSEDICYMLNWNEDKRQKNAIQRQLFHDLNPDEEQVVSLLTEHGDMGIDALLQHINMLPSKAAAVLLNMEFQGVIRCLPGKVYRLL